MRTHGTCVCVCGHSLKVLCFKGMLWIETRSRGFFTDQYDSVFLLLVLVLVLKPHSTNDFTSRLPRPVAALFALVKARVEILGRCLRAWCKQRRYRTLTVTQQHCNNQNCYHYHHCYSAQKFTTSTLRKLVPVFTSLPVAV